MDLHYACWVWWLLLVFMTHFVGYLFLRAYVFYRRRQLARTVRLAQRLSRQARIFRLVALLVVAARRVRRGTELRIGGRT